MLNVLRHKGVSKKILWVVAVIIILSFGVFGTAWRMDKSVNSAGRIFGRNVSISNFQKAYYDSRDAAILMYGDNFFKYGSRLNLESQTWDRLILLHEAKRRGIKTSDQEVVNQVASMPFFQTQGKFDPYRYQMIVQDPRGFDRSTHDFEEGLRSQLTIKKLIDQVTAGIQLTDEDIKKEYILRNEKIQLMYALFEPLKAAKDITVTEDELKKYYESNKEQFRKPAMVNIEYAALNFPDKATDQQKETIKKELESLSKELKSDSDFKAAAAKHKIELKESGLFSQNQPLLTFAWSPDLVQKIFSMKQGQYSPAFETPDGWEILKIKEYQESSIPSYDSIKEDVKTALLTEKGYSLAKNKADEALKAIQEGIKANKSFKEAASGTDAKIEETPLFSRGEYVANNGIIAEFQEIASRLTMKNRLSDVVATSQGPAIIYLEKVENIDEKQFEAEKANFKEMLFAQRKTQATAEFITQLRIKANLKSTVEQHLAK